MFILGFTLFAYIAGSKIFHLSQSIPAQNIAETSGFYIALASMVIGVQLFTAGFIGELVSRNAYDKNNYQIEKTKGV